MSRLPVSPSANVALRMLTALGIDTREQARQALILWCRPSPALSVADVRTILAEFPPDHVELDREDPETGAPIPPGVEGYSPSGRESD